MDYNEIVKSMTQWPWVVFSDEGKTKAFLPAMRSGTVCEVDGLSEADTQAIWQALDGTYGKGINPEVVGELRDAIMLYLVTYADTDTNPTASQENNVVIAMRQAIAHARGAK